MELLRNEPEPAQGYAASFKMVPHPWHGAIIIFDDGQATVQRSRAHHDRPVLAEIEGMMPTPAQLEVARMIWGVLSKQFHFTVTTFCESLLPHSGVILGG